MALSQADRPKPRGLIASLVLTLAMSLALAAWPHLAIDPASSWGRWGRNVVSDVLVLAGLYTVRIFGGSLAVGVPTSSWLMMFSMFLFLSLALVK